MIPEINLDTVFLFDLDGTLVHTDYANFLAYKKAVASVGKSNNLTYTPGDRFNRTKLKSAVPNLAHVEYERIIQEKEKYYNDFLHETRLNEELAEILCKYSKTHKTVLVSNCRRERAIATLKHFGLIEEFKEILCREINSNGKKINKFQDAISRLGIEPNGIIAFENEESEMDDARLAGISIINPTL